MSGEFSHFPNPVEPAEEIIEVLREWHRHAISEEYAVLWMPRAQKKHLGVKLQMLGSTKSPEALGLVKTLQQGVVDVFGTVNGLFQPWGRDDLVRRLNSLWVDLDCYKARPPLNGTDMWGHLEAVDFFDARSIPAPSMVVFSGRGLHLMWFLTGDRTQAFPHNRQIFDRCQLALCQIFKNEAADPAARNASRFLRLPGSINGKNGKAVTIIGGSRDEFSLEELANSLAVPIAQDKAGRAHQQQKKKSKKTGGNSRSGQQLFSIKSLNSYRAKDLEKLNSLRRGFREGHRHFALLYYITALRGLGVKPSELHDRAEAFNGAFEEPFPPSQVETQIRSVLTFNKPKHPRNFTVLCNLAITGGEQKELRTIISNHEKENRRQRHQFDNLHAAEIFAELQNHPLATQAELAEKVGVSQPTISRILRSLGQRTQAKRGRPSKEMEHHQSEKRPGIGVNIYSL